MFELDLFMGVLLDQDMEAALKKANPHLLDYFISSDKRYLQKVSKDEKTFIGKHLGSSSSTSGFDILRENIYSILSKLTSYNTSHLPVYLVAIPKSS